MADESNHGACVDAWMERGAKGLPPDRLLLAFEWAFAALWQRAHQTLGDVTLTAIVDRVIYVSAERYPMLSALKLEAVGLRCGDLHHRASSLDGDQLAQGARFVLVEFLTVLGNLTAEILTPALHAELAKVDPQLAARARGEPRGKPTGEESADPEDTES
jgi:hypothetical protein